ncbi:hypothetical protein chiPu_0033117, partial [Chiloscyllium punctatum]|nr:hypothetical protein [Chiloscyllium punctatum]
VEAAARLLRDGPRWGAGDGLPSPGRGPAPHPLRQRPPGGPPPDPRLRGVPWDPDRTGTGTGQGDGLAQEGLGHRGSRDQPFQEPDR